MINKCDILELIYSYYPKKLSFNNQDYKITNEYRTLQNKKEYYISKKNTFNIIYKKLELIYQNYYIQDWSDVKDSYCYEYKILMHKGQEILDDDIHLMNKLHGKRFDMHIFVSLVSKYYFCFIIETNLNFETNEWSFKNNYNIKEYLYFENIKLLFKDFGYEYLDYNIANNIVNNIETKYLENNHATVFNCLFTDLITLR